MRIENVPIRTEFLGVIYQSIKEAGSARGLSLFNVSIPASMDGYKKRETGELAWVIIDKEARERIERKENRGVFFGYLAPDFVSIRYPRLNDIAIDVERGVVNPLKFELHGEKRPTPTREVLELIL